MTINAHPFDTLFARRSPQSDRAQVTVIMTCYKYGQEGLEALESLRKQTEPVFNLVCIDDHSPDDSAQTLLAWLERYADHSGFGDVRLIRHQTNQGLSIARNTCISQVRTPYLFVLDADNQVYPRALSRLRQALEHSGRAMAYSLIEIFGDERGILGNSIWIPEKFSYGNYVDAMAMIRTSTIEEIGGYMVMPDNFGWEDYDLWCTLVDKGYQGCHVPEILCRYRVHGQSMLRTVTHSALAQRRAAIKTLFESRHGRTFHF